MRFAEYSILPAERIDAAIGRPDRNVRPIPQQSLDFPEIAGRKPPVIAAELAQVDDRVSLDAAGVVDVALYIAQSEITGSPEHRPAAVQSRIPGARNRSPSFWALVYEQHVIEKIDRLEAEHERRVTVLLQHCGREENRLQAVGGARANDATEASHRVAVQLSVIRKLVEPRLNGGWGAQPHDDPALGRGHAGYCLFRSITQMSLCLSPIVK